MFVNVQGDNQIAPTSKWTWLGTGSWQEIKLLGHSQTVAGLSDATGSGVVENTWDETGYGAVTLTINNSADYSFNGVIRDTYGSSGSAGAGQDAERARKPSPAAISPIPAERRSPAASSCCRTSRTPASPRSRSPTTPRWSSMR